MKAHHRRTPARDWIIAGTLVILALAIPAVIIIAAWPDRPGGVAEPSPSRDPAERQEATDTGFGSQGLPIPPQLAAAPDKQLMVPAEEVIESAVREAGAEDVKVAAEEEMEWKDNEAPVEPDEVALLVKPEEEVGDIGPPSDAMAGEKHVPEKVVDECDQFYSIKLSDALRVKRNEKAPEVNFAVAFDELVNPHPVLLVTRLPGEPLIARVVRSEPGSRFEANAEGGEVEDLDDNSWQWSPPTDPDIYCFKIRELKSGQSMCLFTAVLKPYDGSPYIGAYRVGKYLEKPLRNNPRYQRPLGFIEVTEENQNTWVSPHLQLRQFVCKQSGGFPKYMLLESRLLLKLELLIDRLHDRGVKTNSLYVTSGFRTPFYNEAIGNKTFYSRHLYGDAADIYVDANGDGKMDDLDGSGKVTGRDALILHQTIEAITGENDQLVGGLGFYDAASYRNPFIHVDTRGYAARWGR